jgi:uncharacterized membrane protein
VEPPAAGGPAPPPAGGLAPPSGGSELADNLACTLAYIPGAGLIISIIFLVAAPYNRNKRVRFDAWQSIFLHVAWFVAVTLLHALLPWQVSYRLEQLLHLAAVVLLVFLMWKAYQNEKVVLPVVGPFAQKQA